MTDFEDPTLSGWRTLRYSEQTIDGLITDFTINAEKKNKLWNCLESALDAYDHTNVTYDRKSAKRMLALFATALEKTLAFGAPLEMWNDNLLDLGDDEQFVGLGVKSSASLAFSLNDLAGEEHMNELAKSWREIEPTLRKIANLTRLPDEPSRHSPHASDLLQLKKWVLRLMRFWREEKGAMPPITRVDGASGLQSDFEKFCFKCFGPTMAGVSRERLRTPIEKARAHLLYEDKIAEAKARGDFETASALKRNWKDRIPEVF